ncbi:MAG: type II toxin-antitoxin system VapC family toxin [Acidobacteria bacterium]|nr:type II toxin-antitoxin system VapC family toxin [Acidobacteriota bacterium]
MGVLLDTHAFLWWFQDDRRLSQPAREAIADATEGFLSIASCWEIAIKVSRRKLTLAKPIERVVPEQLGLNGFQLLPVDLDDVARVAALPFHHRDPFDRVLAAQALSDELTIVSADPIFRKYGVRRVW